MKLKSWETGKHKSDDVNKQVVFKFGRIILAFFNIAFSLKLQTVKIFIDL